jgi:hypothetical protein
VKQYERGLVRVTHKVVSSTKTTTLTATINGISKSIVLTVNP